jgi:hypothetical protein
MVAMAAVVTVTLLQCQQCAAMAIAVKMAVAETHVVIFTLMCD